MHIKQNFKLKTSGWAQWSWGGSFSDYLYDYRLCKWATKSV